MVTFLIEFSLHILFYDYIRLNFFSSIISFFMLSNREVHISEWSFSTKSRNKHQNNI